MPIELAARLSQSDIRFLWNSAKAAQRMEAIWQGRFREFFKDVNRQAVAWLECNESMSGFHFDILPLLLEHQFQVTRQAIISAESRRGIKSRLAKVPRSLEDLFREYEKWRQKVAIPKAQIKRAEEIRKAYIKKVQQVWVKKGEDFREGREYSREKAMRTIVEHTKMPRARADMTVQTETTRYYNEGRRAVYDKMDDVTHYLFVAIRDFATTKWCRTRQGLVYSKGSAYLDKEVPPIHWNCRSEILPLTPLNPSHAKLINDKSLRRENNKCEPLPKDWVRR